MQNFAAQAVIAMENARLITETREALDQQTATAEVLGVINSSPGDLGPVFDAMLEKAHSLCGVAVGALEIWDGMHVRAVATRGLTKEFDDLVRRGYEPQPNDPVWSLVNGEPYVHVDDLGQIDEPTAQEAVAHLGVGTFLAVALRKDDMLLGRIVAVRQEVHPFSDKQIALLQNFAAQAVIAMENARLLTETREALEQQTATSEVLQVINSAPDDLTPVFDAMLEKGLRLCDGVQGGLWLREGDRFRIAASAGLSDEFVTVLRRYGEPGGPTLPAMQRVLEGEWVFQYADLSADNLYREGEPAFKAAVDDAHVGTVIWVALLRQDVPVGAFV